MSKRIKGIKFITLFVFIIVVTASYAYPNNQFILSSNTNIEFVPQVGGIDWNKPFEKNLTLENAYRNLKNLPPNHTLCIPISKFVCNANSCEKVEPKVFNLIGGSRSDSTISRCDSAGCDTFDVVIDDSGAYKNIQPINPKGFVFKMSFNSIDKKFVEITTLGLDTHVSYGYCMYDVEYKK